MASEPDDFAPYASVGSVMTVIDYLHQKGLPDRVTAHWLANLNLSSAVCSRVLQALRFLGLTDEDDRRTAEAERLRKANEGEEYREVLADLVRKAYASYFAFYKAEDALDDAKLKQAFRLKEPAAVKDRMASLFLGLLQESGLVEGGPASRGVRIRLASSANKRKGEGVERSSRRQFIEEEDAPPPVPPPDPEPKHKNYPLMQHVLHLLPASGEWTQEEKKNWLQLVEASVTAMIRVRTEAPTEG